MRKTTKGTPKRAKTPPKRAKTPLKSICRVRKWKKNEIGRTPTQRAAKYDKQTPSYI